MAEEIEILFNCAQTKLPFPSNIFNNSIVYIEGTEHESERFFEKYGVKSVKPYRRIRMNDDERYTIVGCEVRKSEIGAFKQALYDMQTQMLLLGYRDYEEFCKRAFVELGILK